MSRPALPPIEEHLRALAPQPHARRKVVVTLVVLFVGVAAVLKLTPYQQTVIGNGRVGVYSVMDRPQTVDALIGGRLVEWHVQEGDIVAQGQVLARIEDTESRFLSRQRIAQMTAQLDAQRRRRLEELGRLQELEGQIGALQTSRGQALPIAGQRITQASRRREVAERALGVAQKNLKMVQQVAVRQAAERLRQAELRREQAEDRLRQAEQAVKADTVSLDTQRIQRERIARLLKEGLRSPREDELSERDLVAAQTKLEQSKQAVAIVKRDIENASREIEVVRATNIQADLEVLRAQDQVVAAQKAVDVALSEITVAQLDRGKVAADTSAGINIARSNVQAARAAIASIDDSIAKAELELQNMQERSRQQVVVAPVAGRVARIGKTVGQGQTVKKDDVLLEIVPETRDQAVELILTGYDAPLVTVGRRVRLQFNGFPAVQISGFPQAAVGTFAGIVTNMDPIDEGTGKVRIWVRPDTERIASGAEKPWPSVQRLRPGTDTVGWVLLETVPLWYELWRQFNAFPPDFREVAGLESLDSNKEKGGKNKPAKPLKDGDIKVPKRS